MPMPDPGWPAAVAPHGGGGSGTAAASGSEADFKQASGYGADAATGADTGVASVALDADGLTGVRRRRRPEPTPAQRALALLVRREHARGELRAKLVARGIAPGDAVEAVERMAAEGWQDDARFAASLARVRVSGGYGPGRIRAELAGHGIAEADVEAALEALAEAGDADWSRRARELVLRRYGEAVDGDIALQRRASAFLARRGFDAESARAAIAPGRH